ncbi:MAG: hypothetical protein LAP21_17205 [Acidobacteriia bacterium]|nr:hypothetical protein [Terriglobia bacterium]
MKTILCRRNVKTRVMGGHQGLPFSKIKCFHPRSSAPIRGRGFGRSLVSLSFYAFLAITFPVSLHDG